MKKAKRAAIMVAILCVGLLAGCANASSRQTADRDHVSQSDKYKVVCATFSAYDWVTQVLGERVDRFDVTYLMGGGADLHSYQPNVEDMAAIAAADLFVYVGGESDGWATDAVEAAASPNLRAISLLDAIGTAAVQEEAVEGMQDDDVRGEDEGKGEPEYDEHVWLSLRNAQVLVDALASALSELDPAGAATYAANAESYKGRLEALDEQYAQAVASAPCDTVVFADRFPFRYLTDDYGLAYYAAFAGCSAETEASFETVAFLADKVDELGLGAVLVIEGSDQKIAETVIQNTRDASQKILVMDSLQSVTDADVSAGKSYLAAMEGNLATLTAALGQGAR